MRLLQQSTREAARGGTLAALPIPLSERSSCARRVPQMKFLPHILSTIAAACLTAPAAAQPAARAPGKIVTLNGIQMHYEERGSGEPLLLLHGFGMCGPGDWGHVVDELAKSNRVIMADLRGHGWSTNPSNVFTMRQSGEDVRALLDHLGIARVRAMGISAGGMTLLHLATRYPERVETMVLVGATNEFPEQARKLLGSIEYDKLPAQIAEPIKGCASRGEQQVRTLMSQFRGFKDSHDDMNLTAPILGGIRARTLIVHGDRDEFFPVEIPVTLYRAIPGSQLWVVPDGDHVPIYGGRRAEFLRIAQAFLSHSTAASSAAGN
jgi:pimeloyl-ACP methyl ester carboxylesterase